MATELAKLIDICHDNLKRTRIAKEYVLGERNLSKGAVLRNKIVFFPRNIDKLTEYVSAEWLKLAGLMDYDGSSQYSNYYSIIFPIYDDYGEPIAISARTMLSDQEREVIGIPKYKNSKFNKAQYLLGLHLAREAILKNEQVFVVEGNTDQISMFDAGIENTVACCGTSFSRQHLVKLARYTANITVMLDNDEAGRRSAESIHNKYVDRGINLRFAKLPDGYKDAGEYFLDGGKSKDDFNSEITEIVFDGDWA